MTGVEIIIYLVLGLLGFIYLNGRKSRGKNYPPGPWRFPILGNLPSMGTCPQQACMTWAKKYGPVFSLEFGVFRAVMINDVKLIREVFNDNEVVGRPDFLMITARSNYVAEGVIFTEGKKWMEQRRFILRTLRDFGFGKKTMEGAVQEEIRELIEGFRKTVGKPISTHNRFNAAVVNALWTLIAGERFKHDDPELLKAVEHLAANNTNVNLRASLSNFVPILAKIAPKLSGFDKLVSDIFPILNFLRKPIEAHKATIQEGEPRDFMDVYLNEIIKCEDSSSSFYKEQGDKSMLFTIFDLFLAGAETTSTTLTWTFLYLAKFPEAQKKLQDEILKVVGNSRLPSLIDRPKMPYAEAVIHEVMRFSSLVGFGVPHMNTKELQLGGYTIPKGTMIMANQYGVHHDEKIWGDPENFRPERFLNKDGVFVKHESLIPFSVGKRVCLGETLARDELFLFTSSLFQTFTVSPSTSAKELSIEPAVGGLLVPSAHDLILTEVN